MSRTLQAVLNESNPNKLPTAAEAVNMGDALALAPRFFSGTVTSNVLALPATAKAVAILSCMARTGTSAGFKVPVLPGATLAAGECKVAPNGDIAFFGTDAVTAADVVYVGMDGVIYTETLPVSSNLLTLSNSRRAQCVLSAVANTGTVAGSKTVGIRGSTPATTLAALNNIGTGVLFAVADAVTNATVTYVCAPGVGTGTAPSVAANLLSAVEY